MGDGRAAPARVLVLDAQLGPRESLRMILAPQHQVEVASSAAQALQILRAGGIDLVTLDPRLPDARGTALMRALRREFPELELILISSQTSFESAIEGIRCGIADYLVKPFDVAQVAAAVEHALARRRRRCGPASARAAAGTGAVPGCLERLARAAEPPEAFLGGHGQRVAHYACLLGERIGLHARELALLRLGARLHDVGKIAVGRPILTRPGALTPEQRREMRRHPEIGALVLESFELDARVVAAVRHHHEWWDGSGYPAGLHAAAIPLEARLIQIADAFDAMVCERTYRRAQPRARAAAELARFAGRQFDPSLVKEFLWILQNGVDDDDSSLVAGALALAEPVHESAASST